MCVSNTNGLNAVYYLLFYVSDQTMNVDHKLRNQQVSHNSLDITNSDMLRKTTRNCKVCSGHVDVQLTLLCKR